MKQLTLPLVLAASLLPLSVATSAQAADGFNVGVHFQNSQLGHTIDRVTGSRTNPSISTTTQESDFAGGISFGYTVPLNNALYLGADIYYTEENAETTNINNLLRTRISLNNTYGINFKLGAKVTDRFAVYGIVGQANLDFDINNSYTFAPPLRSGDGSESGTSFGGGFEYDINDKLSFTGEYLRVNDIDFTPLPEVAVPGQINGNELDYDSIKFGLKYSF